MQHLNLQTITFTELKARHPQSAWVRMMEDTWIGERFVEQQLPVGYCAGDLTLDGELDLDAPSRWALLFVAGNLTLGGALRNYNANSGVHLGVTGSLTAAAVIAGGSHIHVDGDAAITHLIYGHYNDGALQIHGQAHVPLVIDNEHDLGVTCGPDTVLAECFCGQDEEDVFVAEVKNDDGEIDVDAILAWLQAGKNPLR